MTRKLSAGLMAAAIALTFTACNKPGDQDKRSGAQESPPRTAQAPDYTPGGPKRDQSNMDSERAPGSPSPSGSPSSTQDPEKKSDSGPGGKN